MNYICTGHVHPERADISFGRIEMEFGNDHRAVASCDASQITVVLDSAAVDGWIAANIVAADVASVVVGALGLSLGSGYSVEIIQVTEPDGTPHVFRRSAHRGDPAERIEPHLPVFNRAFRLSGRDVFFRLAVRDYLRAITVITDCATYCYRAIEGIKSAFVFKTGIDRWDDMHTALGSRSDRDHIDHQGLRRSNSPWQLGECETDEQTRAVEDVAAHERSSRSTLGLR